MLFLHLYSILCVKRTDSRKYNTYTRPCGMFCDSTGVYMAAVENVWSAYLGVHPHKILKRLPASTGTY